MLVYAKYMQIAHYVCKYAKIVLEILSQHLRRIVRVKFECKNILNNHARVFFIAISKHIE